MEDRPRQFGGGKRHQRKHRVVVNGHCRDEGECKNDGAEPRGRALPCQGARRKQAGHRRIGARLDGERAVEHGQEREHRGDAGRDRIGVTAHEPEETQAGEGNRENRSETEGDLLVADVPGEEALEDVEPRRARIAGARQRVPHVRHRSQPRDDNGEDLVEPERPVHRLDDTSGGDVDQQQCDDESRVPRHVRMGALQHLRTGHCPQSLAGSGAWLNAGVTDRESSDTGHRSRRARRRAAGRACCARR